jgi:hypothetical protein
MTERFSLSIAAGLLAAAIAAIAIVAGRWLLGALELTGVVAVIGIGWIIGLTVYTVDYVSDARAQTTPSSEDDDGE